ncbi:MAG TPA: Cd(II)/Pb(II)-responsive transcriptional regulator [Rhodocyclaceae bacterium]|nr:Cd(II)/Pb(II)-responsive transcriptional regulator [Rhodocyclaceae bacterium]
MSSSLRIGELAERAGCLVETIRYYERLGLMPAPGRSLGNYRLYGDTHVDRLLFIRRCRSLGMSLAETKQLLDLHDAPDRICRDIDRLIDDHIVRVNDRLAELQALQLQLKRLRSQCHRVRTVKECGILKSLKDEGNTGRRQARRRAAPA